MRVAFENKYRPLAPKLLPLRHQRGHILLVGKAVPTMGLGLTVHYSAAGLGLTVRRWEHRPCCGDTPRLRKASPQRHLKDGKALPRARGVGELP